MFVAQDYQAEMEAFQQKTEREHIIDWVQQEVVKSITPQLVCLKIIILSLCIVFVSLCFVSVLARVLFPQRDKFLSALFDSWVVIISDPGMELKPGYQLVISTEKKTWLLYAVIRNLMKLNAEKI